MEFLSLSLQSLLPSEGLYIYQLILCHKLLRCLATNRVTNVSFLKDLIIEQRYALHTTPEGKERWIIQKEHMVADVLPPFKRSTFNVEHHRYYTNYNFISP